MSEPDEYFGDIFEDPEGFLPPPPEPTSVTYNYHTNPEKHVTINLIGSSPLYGHILTHACLYLSKFLELNSTDLIKGKTVLEVGSGGALPSVLCSQLGASRVVATDYPDVELIENISKNLEVNGCTGNSVAKGYIWGNPIDELKQELGKVNRDTFDLIILSDVIFNHSEHRKLLWSCKELISKVDSAGKKNGPHILVPFSPHRPKLLDQDLKFFETAKEEEFGFDVEFIDMEMWSPLFKDDTDESTREIRSRVYFYILRPSV